VNSPVQLFEISTKTGTMLAGRRARSTKPEAASRPVVIAIHGGTYTSAYFDVPNYSLLDQALAKGFDIIAVDRPGYGHSTPLDDAPDLIHKNAEYLNFCVPELLSDLGRPDAPVFLIGHSIGGAITVTMAALQPSWTLTGIAISGVGLKTPPDHAENYAHLPQQYFVELPTPMKDQVMFGPEGTFAADMPIASHIANTTVPRSELTDITGGWQQRLPLLAPKVRVPVHYRQGEREKLWLLDQSMIDGFAALFTAAGRVDAAITVEAGHCIDYHLCGANFQCERLDFAVR